MEDDVMMMKIFCQRFGLIGRLIEREILDVVRFDAKDTWEGFISYLLKSGKMSKHGVLAIIQASYAQMQQHQG